MPTASQMSASDLISKRMTGVQEKGKQYDEDFDLSKDIITHLTKANP